MMASRMLGMEFSLASSCAQQAVCGRLWRLCISDEIGLRKFHTTNMTWNDKSEGKSSNPKRKKKGEDPGVNKRLVTKEMKRATVNVAKSLGGNWNKTAEELLARLVSHQEPPSESSKSTSVDPSGDTGSGSLLTSMNVRKAEDKEVRRPPRATRISDNDIYMKSENRQAQFQDSRPSLRRAENFKSLYSGRRLGIFDAESVKAAASSPADPPPTDLWSQMEYERLRKMMGAVPRNGFEEMAQWTREGKMWSFPVDNEEDMHEERKVKFYEHIFLDRHLGEFPDQGPIRKFMELVVIGLGSNPWLSVEEKVGHIQWYAEYFREKESILVASIGEQGKMKEKKQSVEEVDA